MVWFFEVLVCPWLFVVELRDEVIVGLDLLLRMIHWLILGVASVSVAVRCESDIWRVHSSYHNTLINFCENVHSTNLIMIVLISFGISIDESSMPCRDLSWWWLKAVLWEKSHLRRQTEQGDHCISRSILFWIMVHASFGVIQFATYLGI